MAQTEILYSELEDLLDKICESQNNPEDVSFYKTLVFMKQSHYLAPYNALLVQQQRPDATLVCSESRWLKKFGRVVRSGVQPLVIMKNFGPVEFVYDIKDIEDIQKNPIQGYCPNMPTEEVCRKLFPLVGVTAGAENLLKKMLKACRLQDLHIQELPQSMEHAGDVSLVETQWRISRKEIKNHGALVNYSLRLNCLHPPAIRFTTLIHELAHIFCHHLNEFDLPGFSRKELHEREFEAEAVAYLFCYRYGFRPRSEEYLTGYLERGMRPSVSCFDIILKALKRIEDLIKPEILVDPPSTFTVKIEDESGAFSCLTRRDNLLVIERDDGFDLHETKTLEIGALKWKRFWLACQRAGLWNWQAEYTPEVVTHGPEWSVDVTCQGQHQVSAGCGYFPGGDKSDGNEFYSRPFTLFLTAVSQLAGGLPEFLVKTDYFGDVITQDLTSDQQQEEQPVSTLEAKVVS